MSATNIFGNVFEYDTGLDVFGNVFDWGEAEDTEYSICICPVQVYIPGFEAVQVTGNGMGAVSIVASGFESLDVGCCR